MVRSAGVCPVCGAVMPTTRTSCSGRCRALLSRRTRAAALAERDTRLRRLAEGILRELGTDVKIMRVDGGDG